jgi:hypothetical protein
MVINQHFPFEGPPKFTQIWIFGLKINHLATLVQTHVGDKGFSSNQRQHVCSRAFPHHESIAIIANS